MMEPVRLFIAIELPEDVKRDLEKRQQKLKQKGLENLKWVSPESLHITLKFLGETQAELIPGIRHSIDDAAAKFSPFDLGIKHLGAFPAISRPQIIWIGLTGEIGRLQMAASYLEESMAQLGFSHEKRRFSPHLTLARTRVAITPAEKQILAEAINNPVDNLSYPLKVSSISLMQSQLAPGGAIYTRLHMAKLRL